MGEAPGVGAIVVVVGEVLVEVAGEGGAAGNERAGEGWAPALFEDGQLDALDAAVGVGASGADEALARVEVVDGVAELAARNSDPLSVVTSCSFQPAAASSRATRCSSSRVWRALGLRSELCSSAQV